MKAITVKYHGPSNIRGSRIIASDLDGNRVTLSYDCALSAEDNQRLAAQALCQKMGWDGTLAHGSIKGAEVFVFVEGRSTFEIKEPRPVARRKE
jgi:hypothetical protein